MSPGKSRDLAASVKERLLNLAGARGEDFNFLLTRYGAERLLYRLDQSEYASDFVLKGAMLFHIGPNPLPHRPTRDIDLLGKGPPDPGRLEGIFRKLCGVQVVEDGVVFVESSVRAGRIREDDEYKGVRVTLEGRLGAARIPMQVDVGFGDSVTPAPKRVKLLTLLDLPSPRLLIYSWETAIAEKFQALVELGIGNSRMKDFYDLQHLAATLGFDGPTLAGAIGATFERRRMALPDEIPVGLSPTFAEDTAKKAQWRGFLRRLRIDSHQVPLADVVPKLRRFLMPPVEALVQKRPFRMTWPPGGPWK